MSSALLSSRLRLSITHFRACDPAQPLPTTANEFLLNDVPGGAAVHAQLPQFCRLIRRRSVNWPQTFARVGLDFAHYVDSPDKNLSLSLYHFRRKAQAPNSVPAVANF